MPSQKTFFIMRHAKSSWDDSSLKDFDRPLNKRGRRDAPAMGKTLENLGHTPELIISSPALRAKQTVLYFPEIFGLAEGAIQWNEDLYYQGYEAYLESIWNAPGRVSTLLVAGHNPSVEEIVAHLSGKSLDITTANIACFESDAESWSRVEAGNCEFKWLIRPKGLQ